MRPGPEPRWLVLRGWMSDVWDPPVFRKELIDAVAPDNPVYIIRYTHGSAANSKALELAGITRQTADPEGGHLKKDENGELTGEFVERAPRELLDLIPPLPPMTDYEQSRNLVEGTQFYDNKFFVQSVKTVLDGALGSRGAHFLRSTATIRNFAGSLDIRKSSRLNRRLIF